MHAPYPCPLPSQYLALLLHGLNLCSCQALVLVIAVKQLGVVLALSDLSCLPCCILALRAARGKGETRPCLVGAQLSIGHLVFRFPQAYHSLMRSALLPSPLSV
jgi:hypothetical protein